MQEDTVRLVSYIRRGNTSSVRSMLERDPALANGTMNDWYGRRPLNIAAEVGDLPTIQLLLNKGARIDGTSSPRDWSIMPVAHAIAGLNAELRSSELQDDPVARYFAVLHFLLDHGASANTETRMPLVAAAALPAFPQRAELIQMLIDHGAEPTPEVIRDGLSPAIVSQNEDWLHAMPLEKLEPTGAGIDAFLRAGRPDLADYMVRRGGDVHLAGYHGGEGKTRPLLIALPALEPQMRAVFIDFYRKHGGDMNAAMDKQGTTILMKSLPDRELLAQLLDAGADPNARDSSGRTALLAALDSSYHRPSDPNEPHEWWDDKRWKTSAARLANAQLLLAHGADPNAMYAGQTALMLAYPQETGLTDALFAAGGRIDPGDDPTTGQRFGVSKQSMGGASWAAVRGNERLALQLLERDGIGPRDCALAYYAAAFDQVRLLERAIRMGASARVRNELGHGDMLDAAIDRDSADTVAWMIDHRIFSIEDRNRLQLDPFYESAGFATPLIRATLSGSSRVLDALIQRGADLEAHDASGHTALHYARVKGKQAIEKRLERAGARR